MDPLEKLQACFGISPGMARLLALLCANKYVTTRMIEVEYKTVAVARVAMHRLRQQLSLHSIRIRSQRGLGYWLPREDLGKLAVTVHNYTTSPTV